MAKKQDLKKTFSEVVDHGEQPKPQEHPKPEETLDETEEVLEEVEEFATDEEIMEHEGSDIIFEGGPTYDQVEDWKSRFDGEIYMSEFNGVVYIWRPIRRKEYRDIQRIEHSSTQDFEYYLEEQICNACVLWPEDYSSHKMTFGKAGIPTMLSQLIMERSGFLRPATVKL